MNCEKNLRQSLVDHPTTASNMSVATAAARGTGKSDCMKELSINTIYTIIDDVSRDLPAVQKTTPYVAPVQQVSFWDRVFGTAPDGPTTQKSDQIVTNTQVQTTITPQNSDYQQYLYWTLGVLGAGIIAYSLYRLLLYLGEIAYDMLNAHRMVYLKVILPRSDSKNDREREKEVSKDMKEKIGRMSQVYKGLHKLGELTLKESITDFFFKKSKITFIMSYDKGTLVFVVGTYPEYQKVVEGALSAQYPESTIEITLKPVYESHQYSRIIPLEPVKDPIYPIKLFKQFEDDPMNNIIDSLSKVSELDSLNIVMTIKPRSEEFNKKAQKRAEGLYRNDSTYTEPKNIFQKLNPFQFIKFLFHHSEQKPEPGKYAEGGKDYVRMTKSQEDAVNVMSEESSKAAFDASVIIVGSSQDPDRLEESVRNILAAYSIYKDEYNNELDHNERISDVFKSFIKPLRSLALNNHLTHFFFKKNTFSESALTSLWHLPDSVFNRSPVIKWMDYKVLDAPDNIPVLKEPSGFVMTGTIAESYLGGDLSKIYHDSTHRAVGTKTETQLIDYDPTKHTGLEIIEKDGKKYVSQTITKTGLKGFKDGVLIGVNVFRNQFAPIYMHRKDRSRHHYIIGKSGGGKSVLLSFMARQDARNGEGFCVVDPHGDLVQEILSFIPPERARDVIYFDAGNETRPMGLNLYDIKSLDEADRVVNDATEMFLKMFGPEIFGPRLQEYFKFGSLTLLEDLEEGATLLDIPRLFTDESFRAYKTSKVTNPMVRNFWERTYASIGDREKEEIIPYLTAKFVSFTTNSLIRNIIGQTQSAFNFRDIMDNGKILLVNLSKGRIGELNAQLLGMIFVSQINNGAMSRANIEESKRRDFYLYVDEFQNFVTNTFADILSEARKYHLALIMAHQYIAQLDGGASNNIGESSGGKKSVKDAVFGNVGTMQSFKVGAPDAEFLEKEYAPVLSAQDIIGISNYKTYTKLNISNATSRVFSIDSLWSQDYQSKKTAEVLSQVSAMKFGRAKEFVEAEIQARIGIMPNETIDDQKDGDDIQDDQNTDDINIAHENIDTETSQDIDTVDTQNQSSDEMENLPLNDATVVLDPLPNQNAHIENQTK